MNWDTRDDELADRDVCFRCIGEAHLSAEMEARWAA